MLKNQVRPKKIAAVEKVKTKAAGMRRRGIYLLPNLFTTGSLFFGFYSIIASVDRYYEMAVIAMFIAMVFDSLDGRVARLINAQSAFGAQYDSLSDLVSFGIAPALLIYQWGLYALADIELTRLAWLCSFLYVACVALRLAKFNLQTEEGSLSKAYFFGLPCPAAAAMLGATVWVGEIFQISGIGLSCMMVVLTVGLACLMVTNIPYRSFKDIDLKSKIGFTKMVSLVLLTIVVSLWPAQSFFFIFACYVSSGPIQKLLKWRMKRWK
jgi:CDP-diacylglycerol---serine O-phosphatidyltransferase